MKSLMKNRKVQIGIVAAMLLLWQVQSQRVGRRQASGSEGGPLTVERIQTLAALTTLRVEVADARVTEIAGYTGSIKAVLVIHGDVTIGVDLSQARFESVDSVARTAMLKLPQPAVQLARLDHQRTKLIGVWPSGLWVIVPGGQEADVTTINRAYREAEEAVSGAAADPIMIGRSRRQAEQVLRVFFETLGWSVEIRWSG
jgi:hypothetical protein